MFRRLSCPRIPMRLVRVKMKPRLAAVAISVFFLFSVGCRRGLTIVTGSQSSGWYLMVPPSPSRLYGAVCLRSGKPLGSGLCLAWESWYEKSWDDDQSFAKWLSLRPYDSTTECLAGRARLSKVADLILLSNTEKQATDADKQLAQTVDSLYRDFDNRALGQLHESIEFDADTWDEQIDRDSMEIPARRWKATRCIAADDPRLMVQ